MTTRFRVPEFDLYQELGVPPTATQPEIRAAYLYLAKLFHPDGLAPAPERMIRVNQAYNILGNAEDRAAYDKVRASSRGESRPATPPSPTPAAPNSQGFRIPTWLVVVGLVITVSWAVSYFGEQDVRGDIDAQNDAASDGRDAPGGTGPGGTLGTSNRVDVFALRVGDCIRDTNEGEIGEVVQVSCTSPMADLRVTSLFTVSAADFPTVAYFETEAGRRCRPDAITFFYPTAESWDLGDRTITCLAALP